MSRMRTRGRGMGAAAFSPADLPGLKAWQEADIGVLTDVDGVYQWDPAGGSGLPSFIQATGSKKPQAGTGGDGKAEVQFDGIDDGLASATTVTLNPSSLSAFFVVSSNSFSRVIWWHKIDGSNQSTFWTLQTGGNGIVARRGGVSSQGDLGTSGVVADGAQHLYRWMYDGVGANHKFYVDGVSDFTPTTPGNNPGTASQTATIELGNYIVGGAALSGEFRAALVFSPILSSEDATLVETYLNAKWAVY